MNRLLKNAKLAILGVILLFACQEQNDLLIQDQQEVMPDRYEPIPGQYIVVLNDETGGARLSFMDYKSSQIMMKDISESLLSGHQIKADVKRVYSKTIKGFVATFSDDELLKIRNDNRVKYIEQDYLIILGKPSWAGGGGGSPDVQETPWGITRVNQVDNYDEEIIDHNGTGSPVAWVIDTGIDLDHEDLNVDASRGFTAFKTGKDGRSFDDGHGHGTHVAGTIAAIDNDFGVVGVAAGATVIPVKVLNSRGSGSYSGVIEGVDYVAGKGSNGDVANMSLGGPAEQALDDAVIGAAAKGIIFCLAAGNESDDANNHSPARANGPNIVTISAMDANDDWALFSNYGSLVDGTPIDYCAPGVNIKSTWKGGGYNTISGTSMAAPHAAGVMLLLNKTTTVIEKANVTTDVLIDGEVKNDPDNYPDPIIVH